MTYKQYFARLGIAVGLIVFGICYAAFIAPTDNVITVKEAIVSCLPIIVGVILILNTFWKAIIKAVKNMFHMWRNRRRERKEETQRDVHKALHPYETCRKQKQD